MTLKKILRYCRKQKTTLTFNHRDESSTLKIDDNYLNQIDKGFITNFSISDHKEITALLFYLEQMFQSANKAEIDKLFIMKYVQFDPKFIEWVKLANSHIYSVTRGTFDVQIQANFPNTLFSRRFGLFEFISTIVLVLDKFHIGQSNVQYSGAYFGKIVKKLKVSILRISTNEIEQINFEFANDQSKYGSYSVLHMMEDTKDDIDSNNNTVIAINMQNRKMSRHLGRVHCSDYVFHNATFKYEIIWSCYTLEYFDHNFPSIFDLFINNHLELFNKHTEGTVLYRISHNDPSTFTLSLVSSILQPKSHHILNCDFGMSIDNLIMIQIHAPVFIKIIINTLNQHLRIVNSQ